jgi:hypothetical protein
MIQHRSPVKYKARHKPGQVGLDPARVLETEELVYIKRISAAARSVIGILERPLHCMVFLPLRSSTVHQKRTRAQHRSASARRRTPRTDSSTAQQRQWNCHTQTPRNTIKPFQKQDATRVDASSRSLPHKARGDSTTVCSSETCTATDARHVVLRLSGMSSPTENGREGTR